MISSLREGYWSNAFSEIRRVTNFKNPITSNGTDIASSVLYTVKKGDTLYAISRKFKNVSVSEIMSFNGLTSSSLKPGMQLKIPN